MLRCSSVLFGRLAICLALVALVLAAAPARGEPVSSILITEAETSTPDAIEIQNRSAETVNTTGWFAIANHARDYNINDVHSPIWDASHPSNPFPESIGPGEVVVRADATGDNIYWRAGDEGWVALLDNELNVVDFVIWGYDLDQSALEIYVDTNLVLSNVGNDVFDTWGNQVWSGPEASSLVTGYSSLQRIDVVDHDTAPDWSWDYAGSVGDENVALIPEPSTVVLLLTGVIMLSVSVWRRRRRG